MLYVFNSLFHLIIFHFELSLLSEKDPVEVEEKSNSKPGSPLPQSEASNEADKPAEQSTVIVEDVYQQISLVSLMGWSQLLKMCRLMSEVTV